MDNRTDVMATLHSAKSGIALALGALPLLAGCVSPAGSLSSKSAFAIDSPSELCDVSDPSDEMVRAVRARSDYAAILIALSETCPEQAEVFGIGATSSIPDLRMDVSNGGERQLTFVASAQPEPGPDVTPPDLPPVDLNDPANQVVETAPDAT